MGFQSQAVGISDLGSVRPPSRYISNPPYFEDTFQVQEETSKVQKMVTYIGHQCGKLAVICFPINLGSYVLQFSFKPNYLRMTMTQEDWYK